MKRIINIAFSLVLMLGLFIPTYAQEANNIDNLLAPYQAIIDKVNAELGSTIYIPEKNKEKVYNNIKDMSPEEVEALLRNEYKAYVAGESLDTKPESGNYTRDSAMTKDQSESVVSPTSVREDITQTVYIGYSSEMFLNSTVFSGTGTAGTFIYESINDYGSQWPANYTGYHFDVDSGSYSLSSDRKKCTVTLIGHPEDAYGFAQAVLLTATNTFNAN